jgi:PAS domain S-box-containing protein
MNQATARRRIEAALRSSEERSRLIGESASDMIALLDPQGRYVYLSPSNAEFFDDYEGLIGTSAFSKIHANDRERIQGIFLDTVRTGTGMRAEFRLVLSNGDMRYIESQGDAIRDADGSVSGVLVVSRDVTARCLTESALRSRESQLSDAQRIANVGSWEWDLRSNSFNCSEQLLVIYGLRHETPPSRYEDLLAEVHPEDRERVEAIVRDALAGGKPFEFEQRIVRPDATVRILHTRGRADHDDLGQPIRVIGVCQDITERGTVEEQTGSSEERFRLLVENIHDYAIILLDVEGRVTSWNLGAERMKGYRTDEILGQHFSCFYPPEGVKTADPSQQLRVAAATGKFETEGWRVRKDGLRFWAHVIITPLLDRYGILRGYSKITRDITERKRADEHLRSYAERLQTTSRRLVEVQEAERRHLAAELHDLVGQKLTALGINLKIVAGSLPEDLKEKLSERLADSASLLRATVESMRYVMGELRPIALDEYGLIAALRSHAAHLSVLTGISISIDGKESTNHIPSHVELAIFRIAQEALNNIVKHANAGNVQMSLSEEGPRVRFVIQDDGIGFDPTRVEAANPDAGWGLLIMRERAEAVGARFVLDAGPGRGARVIVTYLL